MATKKVKAKMVMMRFRGGPGLPSALEIKAGPDAAMSLAAAPWRLIVDSGNEAAILAQVQASVQAAYTTPGAAVPLTIKLDDTDPTFGTIVSSP